jgi:hypothetical protein
MKLRALSIFIAISMVATVSVEAACSKRDAVGTWVSFQNNITTPEGLHVGKCTLDVIKDNSWTGNCQLYFQNSTYSNPGAQFPVGGTVTVNRDCSAEIVMKWNGGEGTHYVQISNNKMGWSGIWNNSYGNWGNVTAVRRK